MIKQSQNRKKLFFKAFQSLVLLFYLLVFNSALATYDLKKDLVSNGGGESSSGNYGLEDSLGETVVGPSDSSNYMEQQGFWQGEDPYLLLEVDSSSVNFGSLIPGTSATAQSLITVTTNAVTGYDLYISQNNDLTHTTEPDTIAAIACNISSPCSWPGDGFGFSVIAGSEVEAKWGNSPNFNYAAFPTSSTNFHSTSYYNSSPDDTTVQYKVQIPDIQVAGEYTNQVTYTVMADL
jgi:hypothetical protein